METKRLFAGFDGGGSKTSCALCDEKGQLLGIGLGGPSNFRYCGEETAQKSMRDALANAFGNACLPAQKLDTAYVSSAAIRTYDGDRYRPFFAGCTDSENVICEGDLYPIWYGACGERPGIVLIAGTGSVAYLFRGTSVLRAGGWGPQVGDEGSGYDIGLSAMRRVMRMSDAREKPDPVFCEEILRHYRLDDEKKLIALSQQDRSVIASCASTVCRLAESGNQTACALLNAASHELALLVKAVLAQDSEADSLPLVLSGGLMGEGSILKRMLCRKVLKECPRLLCAETAKASPAAVCAALALKKAGLPEASDRLLENAKEGTVC